MNSTLVHPRIIFKVKVQTKEGVRFAIKSSDLERALNPGLRYKLTDLSCAGFPSPFLAKDAAGFFLSKGYKVIVEDNKPGEDSD